MATGGLYGSSITGTVAPQSGSESVGLYGNNTVFGGTYFEWFIFQTNDLIPATPTGGSWDFTTNTGIAPTGWSSSPPANPTATVWISISVVSSKTNTAFTWSSPGKFAYASGLPILSGTGTPSPGLGVTDQLYIQTNSVPENIWFKQIGTWTVLTGSSLYVDLTNNQTIAGTKTFSSQIQGSVSGTSSNVNGIVAIGNGGTGATTSTDALTNLGAYPASNPAGYISSAGTVTSVSATVPTGLAISGSPITTSGTLAITNEFGYAIPTTANQTNWDTAYTDRNKWDGGATNLVAATGRTSLGLGSAAVLTAGAANGVATLDSGGTVPLSQIPASIQGGVSYQGAWNASTNTPTLTSSVGTKGYYYVVSVAGSTNLNGVTNWNVGDWAIFNGTTWEKIDNTDAVTSVNGYTGTVVLSNTDISGFGTMSTQNSNAISVTGGTVSTSSLSNNTVTNNLFFTPTTAPTYVQGDVWYDSSQKTLAYYNDATNNVVHVGQEIQVKVVNNTGSTITIGAPVYVTSTTSGQIYPNVALAKADSISTSSVLGLATQAIASGSIGYVTCYGILQPCNTALYNVGDILYLSPYTAGVLMNTIPPTGNVIIVGVVAYKNSPSGSIYVKQQNSYIVSAGTITGVLPIDHGGTNATTAAAALVSLGVQTSATGSEIIPAGTTGQRDVTPAAGYFRFNTSNVQFEGYNGTAWSGVGGASGGGGNPIMYENDSVVSVSYTMTTGKNASSTGPLVINAGISVTVPSGSVWVIL